MINKLIKRGNISELENKLAGIIADYDLFKIEFKIEGHRWNIESYAGRNYRLGSWGANCWVDIGDCKDDLLRAIDYNLGDNRDKLTAIYLDDNTEIEL